MNEYLCCHTHNEALILVIYIHSDQKKKSSIFQIISLIVWCSEEELYRLCGPSVYINPLPLMQLFQSWWMTLTILVKHKYTCYFQIWTKLIVDGDDDDDVSKQLRWKMSERTSKLWFVAMWKQCTKIIGRNSDIL